MCRQFYDGIRGQNKNVLNDFLCNFEHNIQKYLPRFGEVGEEYQADLLTGREREMTTGEQAEQSGFCCNLTIFGYLHCARCHQVSQHVKVPDIIMTSRVFVRKLIVLRGSDAFADQSQRTHNNADQSQRRAPPT